VTDLVLKAWTCALIEKARRERTRLVLDRGPAAGGSSSAVARSPWRPGQPLRILFVGYNGARNTGSDVRVQEILRQVRHVLGPERVEISVVTQDFELTRGYFGDARQLKLPDIFPPFLEREIPKHHGVVACEGSMFKSQFADALTALMIGSLGVASARDQLSVGYGAEAGAMSRTLRWMTKRYCGSSLVITRNPESESLLRSLEVPAEPGTDTAWTFEPHPADYGRKALRDAGWDGVTPALAICPINPFWWPVRPSLIKSAARHLGAWRSSHYRSVYFHRSGAAVDRSFETYLETIARAVRAFRGRRSVFPVLVAMERLDRIACERLAEKLGGAPIFHSEKYDMFEVVSILRACHMIVSSRFHAIVTSMPSLVASAGITMDERIRNLMRERGHEHLLAAVDDPDLEVRLLDILEKLWEERDALGPAIGRSVVRNLERMARMGHFFEEEVARRFPEFRTRMGLVPWEEYLPPLAPELTALVQRWGDRADEPVFAARPGDDEARTPTPVRRPPKSPPQRAEVFEP
jgi:polysaccharide pyruvyl transferase WcaK-like protein